MNTPSPYPSKRHRAVLIGMLFCFAIACQAQSPRGFYFGYQGARIIGGMNNLRAFVGSENERYKSLTKEMKYTNFLHGVSIGYIIRKKQSSNQDKFSKKPFFEINWNSLHNSYTAKGSGTLPQNADYTSQYKVRLNGLALLMGIQIQKKGTLKLGFQPSRFSIRYKGAPTADFSSTKFQNVTDPEGFPEFLFHFNYDYSLSKNLYFRAFLNIPIAIEKELGYYYKTRNIGGQILINLN